MLLRIWRFVTLLLAALALTMTSAHVLELPQKMQFDASLYASVNSTMYLYFAIVGGVYTIGSIVSSAILAFLVRHHGRSFRLTVAGASLLTLAFLSWLALVAPVNAAVEAAMQASPESVPALWMRLRSRWEYGHATGFVIQLLGFSALVASVIVETPERMAPATKR